MITWGPWQEYAPGSDVEAFQRGFGQGADIVNQHVANKQRQAEIAMEKERLSKEEQQMEVNQQLAKQQQQMNVEATARRYQAQQGYQQDVPRIGAAAAFAKWGPLMGASLAGFGTDISQISRAGALGVPPLSQAPVSAIPGAAPQAAPAPTRLEASPVYQQGTDTVIGDQFGGKFYRAPAPKASTGTGRMSDVDREDLRDIDKELSEIQTQVMGGKLVGTSLNKARIRVEQLNAQKKALMTKYTATAPTAPPPPGPSDTITFLPPPGVPGTTASAPAAAPPAGAGVDQNDPAGIR